MAKLGLKAGEKLDMSLGGGEEKHLKTSLVKEAGDLLHLSLPILDGKAFTPATGTPVVLTWGAEGAELSLDCTATGTVKQGIRTYLTVRWAGEVHRRERRAFQRIPAELEAELICSANFGAERAYPARTSDISTGGVAVYTDAPLNVGNTITIVLYPKGGKELKLQAVVCWLSPAPKRAGFAASSGLQFAAPGKEEGAELARLLAALTPKS